MDGGRPPSVAVTAEGPLILTALDRDLDGGPAAAYNDYFVGRVPAAGREVEEQRT
jgi:hypothetical protein